VVKAQVGQLRRQRAVATLLSHPEIDSAVQQLDFQAEMNDMDVAPVQYFASSLAA